MPPEPANANATQTRPSSPAITRALPIGPGTPPAQDWSTEMILRATTALGLIAIALIHFLDLFSKLHETPYLGIAYIALIAGCLIVATQLVGRPRPAAWRLAGGLAAATLVAYAISRSVGFPRATGDIGNWEEPLGLASLFVESLVVVLSGYALAYLPPGQGVALATQRG